MDRNVKVALTIVYPAKIKIYAVLVKMVRYYRMEHVKLNVKFEVDIFLFIMIGNEGFFAENKVCLECTSPCRSCSNSATECLSCSLNTFLKDNTCL